MRIAALIAVAYFMCIGTSHAGSQAYICTVTAFHRLADDGNLSSSTEDPIVGKVFTVDRESGKIIGKYISSTGFETKVLDSGSEKQSFKVVATNPLGFLHVLYLVIEEFQRELRKPFILFDGTSAYSGTCE